MHKVTIPKFTVIVKKGSYIVGEGNLLIDAKPRGLCGFIEDVMVDEDHRGKGYGGQIIDKLIQLARDCECYKVILDCADHNVPLYEKFGFYKWENSMRLNL